jgi:ABC-2 type transport system permease protein
MSNTLAIAQKELRAYFASPIAYIVLGFFALLFGWFYIGILDWFVRQGMQMGEFGMQGPQNMNVNQQMIRPLLLNMTVVFLFLLPLITMRTYAEEKRSGTIELLLTSPLTDLQIVAGKFVGAMGLYAAMLAVTLVHFGLLFKFGNPDWKPLAVAYLGLLLFGGCFISVGLFISSLTKNQIVAGAATFGVFLLLWVIDWIGQSLGPTGEAVLKYLSMTEHLDDFVKGVVDTKHLVYYLSFIAFGLFLTVRSVDTERWRG